MSKVMATLQRLLFSITASQLIAGMLGAVLVLAVVHFTEPHPKPLATVDITGIVQQFVHAQAKQHLPTLVLQQRVKVFGQQLQTALNTVARQHQMVLVVQEAVVAGAPDLTPVVKQRLASLLNERQ